MSDLRPHNHQRMGDSTFSYFDGNCPDVFWNSKLVDANTYTSERSERLREAREAYDRSVDEAVDAFGGLREEDCDYWDKDWPDTCGDPGCPECYGPPDAQARAEVDAHLNRLTLDTLATSDNVAELRTQRDGAIGESESYRELYNASLTRSLQLEKDLDVVSEELDYASTEFWKLVDKLNAAEEMSDRWTQRAFLLEAAVRSHASHAWNDIKQALAEL